MHARDIRNPGFGWLYVGQKPWASFSVALGGYHGHSDSYEQRFNDRRVILPLLYKWRRPTDSHRGIPLREAELGGCCHRLAELHSVVGPWVSLRMRGLLDKASVCLWSWRPFAENRCMHPTEKAMHTLIRVYSAVVTAAPQL